MLRFSLTTLFTVSILSALLLWLNMRWRESSGYFDWVKTTTLQGAVDLEWTECAGRGFPAVFEARLRAPGTNRDFFHMDLLILNVVGCGLVVFIVALFVERAVRRRSDLRENVG